MGSGTGGRWLWLGGVLVVATAAMTLAFNPAPHTGGDNAGYISLAVSLLETGTYTEIFDPAAPSHTKYPPVFPGLLALAMLVGARSWVALKLVAATSTLVAVAFTFLWAEWRIGREAAAAVSLALALSSVSIYYSHWILSDPTFLAFTVVALWAFDRAERDHPRSGRWVALSVSMAMLAYFTRTAGLPLLVAVLAVLAHRRQWGRLGAAAVGIGVPAVLWWWRGRAVGSMEYASEFLMLNPLMPEMGRAGVVDLGARVLTNVQLYLTTHIPGGILGRHAADGMGDTGGAYGVLLGVGLVVLALVGWFVTLRKSPGLSEVFFPLYAGLILLWPALWSADRFAWPLFPLLFAYSATGVSAVGRRWGGTAARVLAVAALSAVLLPAGLEWSRSSRDAVECAAKIRGGDVFACAGQQYQLFADAARWSGANLPEESAVLTRKPRLFFVLSGRPSRTFPYDPDPRAHLELGDRLGARYELLDQVGSLAMMYVGGAVRMSPGAYCLVQGFGQENSETILLGILPPATRRVSSGAASGDPFISPCPPDYTLGDGTAPYASSSSRIPLLERLDP